MIVDLLMPCRLEYLPPRKRAPRSTLLWKRASLEIASPISSEAPLAFRVTALLPRENAAPTEILVYDGRFWWPLLDHRSRKSINAADFVAGLASGSNEALRMVNQSWVFFSGAKSGYDKFFAENVATRIVRDGSDEGFAVAQRGAAKLMMCNDVVHVADGPPVFFCTPTEHVSDHRMSLRAGCPVQPWHLEMGLPLPRVGGRSGVERGVQVVDIAGLEQTISVLKERGISVQSEDRVESFVDLSKLPGMQRHPTFTADEERALRSL